MANNNSSSSKNLVLLGVGIAAGWLMKQLFDSPEGREKRQEMMASVENLRTRLSDPDEPSRIMSIFGSTTKEVTKLYQDAKTQIIAELSDLHVSLDKIDKQKYKVIVTDIVAATGKQGSVPKAQLDKLKEALVEDFKKLEVTSKKAQKNSPAPKKLDPKTDK